jgi:hypothetical protein
MTVNGSIPSLSSIIIGIVGSEQKKFTPETEAKAREIIRELLSKPEAVLCSGHCHLGGIDIFAEEEAKTLGKYDPKLVFAPLFHDWSSGYKPRNLRIATHSDEVYCITLKELPEGYDGMRFPLCYHCGTKDHVKSGGCYTVKEAIKLGKTGKVIVI